MSRPQHVVPGVPEHLFGCRVEFDDPALVVDGDDGVEGRGEDGRSAGLAALPGFLGHVPLRLVPHDLGETPEFVVVVPQRRHRPAAPEAGAVLADVPAVVVPPTLLQRLLHLLLRVALLDVLRGEEDGD